MGQPRLTFTQIQCYLDNVGLGSVLYDRPEFRLIPKGDGFILQLRYWEPDINDPTGPPKRQSGRKYYISPFSTETEIIRTAHLAVGRSLQHRLGEHFTYEGKRIFDPHLSVQVLRVLANNDNMDLREGEGNDDEAASNSQGPRGAAGPCQGCPQPPAVP